jgi:hypothetical protein
MSNVRQQLEDARRIIAELMVSEAKCEEKLKIHEEQRRQSTTELDLIAGSLHKEKDLHLETRRKRDEYEHSLALLRDQAAAELNEAQAQLLRRDEELALSRASLDNTQALLAANVSLQAMVEAMNLHMQQSKGKSSQKRK